MSKPSSIILTITLLVSAFPLLWNIPAGAYWLESDAATVTINDLRKDAPPSDRKDIFTVPFYDGAPADRDANTPAILPHTDYFIPADIIDANLPIFGLFSRPAEPAKDPLANLLYANLKLKKLLEEYDALQKSAVKYLGYQPAGSNHFKSFLPAKKAANNQEDEPDQQANIPTYKPFLSYYRNFRNLRGIISRNQRPLILREHASRQQTPEQPRTTATVLEPYACGEATNTFRNSSRLPGYTSNYSTYQGRQETTLPAAEQLEPREQRATTREDHKPQLDANDKLGKFIISFRKYIIHHPLEFILFAVLGICTLNFITRIVLAILGF